MSYLSRQAGTHTPAPVYYKTHIISIKIVSVPKNKHGQFTGSLCPYFECGFMEWISFSAFCYELDLLIYWGQVVKSEFWKQRLWCKIWSDFDIQVGIKRLRILLRNREKWGNGLCCSCCSSFYTHTQFWKMSYYINMTNPAFTMQPRQVWNLQRYSCPSFPNSLIIVMKACTLNYKDSLFLCLLKSLWYILCMCVFVKQ